MKNPFDNSGRKRAHRTGTCRTGTSRTGTCRLLRTLAAILLLPTLMVSFSGCWDAQELEQLFIVTGLSLDKGEEPGELDLALQIAKPQQQSGGSGKTGGGGRQVIIMNTQSDTIHKGLALLDINSNHTLMLQHNQVFAVGSELAQQGFEDQLDFFFRFQQARIDVPIVVVEGRAEDILTAQIEQDKNTGIFMAQLLNDMSRISKYLRVNILDFAFRLLEKATAPMAPLFTVGQENGEPIIRCQGLAVFRDDKMIGQLSVEDSLGYIWAMGGAKLCNTEAVSEQGRALLHVSSLKTKKKISLREDGGVKVALTVYTNLRLSELEGFSDIKIRDLTAVLTESVQDGMKARIVETFEKSRDMDADIYGFGEAMRRKNPKAWKNGLSENWPELYRDLEFSVEVKAKIPVTGKIIQSLKMEGLLNESR